MMQCVMAHPDLQGLRRIMLVTSDAHGLYALNGFAPPVHLERIMERVQPPSAPESEYSHKPHTTHGSPP